LCSLKADLGGADKGFLSGDCYAREVAAFFEIYGAFPSGLAWLNFGSRLNFDE
jgi:hypothetical protein